MNRLKLKTEVGLPFFMSCKPFTSGQCQSGSSSMYYYSTLIEIDRLHNRLSNEHTFEEKKPYYTQL